MCWTSLGKINQHGCTGTHNTQVVHRTAMPTLWSDIRTRENAGFGTAERGVDGYDQLPGLRAKGYLCGQISATNAGTPPCDKLPSFQASCFYTAAPGDLTNHARGS